MAAVMEAGLDRSPSPADDPSDDEALVDEHLLAEEKKLHRQRLASAAKEEVVNEVRRPENAGAGAKLLELVDKSLLYSSFLADQFKGMVDSTLAEAETSAPEQRPAKRAKGRRGKPAATPTPQLTATQRLLPLIKADLRPYQLKGVAWLISLYKNGVNGILADEMGLGKTLQTIGFISFLWMHCKDTSGKYMVLGPLSTLPNWVNEFKKFCPDLPVLLYHGTPAERQELRREYMKQDASHQMPVIVTSYEIVMADRKHLERHTWKLLVVDEGHRLKNFECRLIRELRALRTDSRLLLTGTPLQNNLRELWSLLSFCMPLVFADADQFLDWFDIRTSGDAIPASLMSGAAGAPTSADSASTSGPKQGGRRGRPSKGAKKAPAAAEKEEDGQQQSGAAGQQAGDSNAATMVTRLHGILKPFVLRRVKADVNIGVPPKQEMVLYAEMTEEQRRLTRGLIDGTLKEELAKEAAVGGGSRNASLNNLIMQMRKVCNHPDLITGHLTGTSAYPSAAELVEQCGKLALLNRLLKALLKEGHRVLIFSQMTEMLNVLEAYLQDLGLEAARIDGSVPWQTRQKDIADFQSDGPDGRKIFLLSTRAGGLGINLTAADTVIIYDSDWNPHQDSQAMDRCHRIGQKKPVLVFRLVTSNSVENRMLAKADSKKALERIIIKKGAFKELLQDTSSTSVEELAQLLNPDRRSADLAQSGVVSDEVLRLLLDRSHLAKAFEESQAAAQAAGSEGGEASRSDGPPLPPYPLVGPGYEVVTEEPRRAVGLLQRIEGEVKEGAYEEEEGQKKEEQ